jgi:8-oxo-dGTP pyrophosphatase MutT (NUDIX family)
MESMRKLARDELSRYLRRHPDETTSLVTLVDQLREDGNDLCARSNMRGHITTSALVLDAAGTHMLLVHHKVFDRWLQPGGHVEGDSSFWEAACREVLEETAVGGLVPVLTVRGEPAVFDIDSHPIPANAKKNEAEHRHHDFLYIARAPARAELAARFEEVNEVRWFSLADAAAMSTRRLGRTVGKLREAGLAR